jgi:dethiobiotin synthetase
VHAPLIVVTGTGTGIGKTYLAAALLRAWSRRRSNVLGYKPIESGVGDSGAEDADALAAASSFHVKQLPHVHVRAPLSPHLALRLEGRSLDVARIVEGVSEARGRADAVVVELPGGLFTPLADDLLAVDFAAKLEPTALVLVAPDRLGVLHDVLAAIDGARAHGCPPTHVLLNAVATPDASSGTNAAELRLFSNVPVFGPVARDVTDDPALDTLVQAVESVVAPAG